MEQLQKESIKDRNEANIEKKPQGITEQKEEEEIDLKAKYCPKYSKYEMVKKSSVFSLKNWKFILCNQIRTISNHFFSLYLPFYRKRIIDSTTKKKTYDILLDSVKMYIFFLFIKLLINIFLEIFSYYFISDSKTKYTIIYYI